jgi:hypothetical protein
MSHGSEASSEQVDSRPRARVCGTAHTTAGVGRTSTQDLLMLDFGRPVFGMNLQCAKLSSQGQPERLL